MEREKGFEPSTSTLARLHSTTELLPQWQAAFLATRPLQVKPVVRSRRRGRSWPPDRVGLVDTIGRYQVVRLLGNGGMGQVFLARDPTLERDVALKLLRRDAKQTTLRDEAKALAALNHPGIVTIYEIGEHDGQDFITMEYLAGRSLRQLLQES